MTPETIFADGTEHLLAEFEWLDLLLQRQVQRLRAARLIAEDELRGLYIPDAQVDALLQQAHDPDLLDDELSDAQTLTFLAEQIRADNTARVQASLRAGITLPLIQLTALFDLSPFELDVLLICCAPEVDLRYEVLYAYVQNDVTKKRPSVDLALKLLCPTIEGRLARRSVFDPDAPLFRHQLLQLFDDPQDVAPPLLARFLKADRRIVDYLIHRDQVDARLLPFTQRMDPLRRLADLQLPEDLVTSLRHASQPLEHSGGVFLFNGPKGVGKRSAAEAICAQLGRPLLVADLQPAADAKLPLAATLTVLRREAQLQGAGLYLAHLESLLEQPQGSRENVDALVRSLAAPEFPVFLGSEVSWQPAGIWAPGYLLSFEFPLPVYAARLGLWHEALHGNGHLVRDDVDLAALANKFVLSGGQIQAAARHAGHLTAVRAVAEREISTQDLHAAARSQSNQGLRKLAQKIEPIFTWSDIVLPSRAMQQLREVYAAVRFRHVVYAHWGFDQKLSLGKGINALFSGSSGTGKTMAAQILANELSLDIYKIDLASVVSKYIGETEQNLDRIFREARASNAILFFDEADALFGKRSEVKDAHDRYANIEVAYLLQKMEEYDGIVILATNLRRNLDEAFTRRMHHIVDFPFPNEAQRDRIWRGMFPAEAPLAEGVDFGFLARQFELPGGNIRNVALTAAFMAAELDEPIRMEHLILATAREIQKMGKLPAKSEFGQYYELIRTQG